ncbi:uncharacterized protein LOC112559789 [Pomacea canaliculata]|uniref:uncharacterized protein LOC112559789 n=1 Tax=Pomacea canaliculata TaxID=400727 RepID=UPI000D737977|nr:uncharacterized protein LOC112559789 [Pomacea canaliculata]
MPAPPSVRAVVVVAALMVLSPVGVQCQCRPNDGPAGNMVCISASQYENQSQFATCRTNSYVLRKSRGDHACLDDGSAYCYYQCMLEMHDKESGPVSSDCSCTSPLPPRPTSSLPSKCYSPSGADCSWYRDCLEMEFSCAGGRDNYAMAYSEHLCTIYKTKKHLLTESGQRWLNATNACLQAELVPMLQPFRNLTCEDVKSRACKTQALCYLNPYLDYPSVCELQPADVWTVFWTIRDAFRSHFVESIFGLMKVASSCTAISTLTSDMQHLRVRILHADVLLKTRELFSDLEASTSEKRKSLQTRRKRQTEENIARVLHRSLAPEPIHLAWKGVTNTQLRIHQLANEAVDSLARQLDWDEGGVIWFAFAADQHDRETLDLHVLLGDRHAFHLANPWSPRSDLSKVTLQAGSRSKTPRSL